MSTNILESVISNIYKRGHGSKYKNKKDHTIYVEHGCVVENNNQLTFSNWSGYTVESCLVKARSRYIITKICFSRPQITLHGNHTIQKVRTGEIFNGVDCYVPYTCAFNGHIKWLPSNITHIVLHVGSILQWLPKNIQFFDGGQYPESYDNFIFSKSLPKYLKYLKLNSSPSHGIINMINKNLDTLILCKHSMNYIITFSKKIRITNIQGSCVINGKLPKKLINLTFAYNVNSFNCLPKNLVYLSICNEDRFAFPDGLKQLKVTSERYSKLNFGIYDNLHNGLKIMYCKHELFDINLNKPNNCIINFYDY